MVPMQSMYDSDEQKEYTDDFKKNPLNRFDLNHTESDYERLKYEADISLYEK